MFVQKDVSQFQNMCIFCWQVSPKANLTDSVCPHCGKGPKTRDWLKPPIEVALFKLQDEYLKTKSREVLGQMYLYLWQYAIGKIRKMAAGKINLTSEVIEEKAMDAATLFIEYYLKKPDFSISTSFGSYLAFQIRAVLYNQKEKENDQCDNLQAIAIPEDRMLALSSHAEEDSSTHHEIDRQLAREGLLEEVSHFLRSAVMMMMQKLPRRDVLFFLLGVKYYLTTRILRKKAPPYQSLFQNSNGVEDYIDAVMLDFFRFLKTKDINGLKRNSHGQV